MASKRQQVARRVYSHNGKLAWKRGQLINACNIIDKLLEELCDPGERIDLNMDRIRFRLLAKLDAQYLRYTTELAKEQL